MVIFCSAEWPSFNVGWPPEGTFDLRTVRRVQEIILRPQSGHPDQVPYILVWEDLIVSPTPWIQPFLPPQAAAATEILVAEEKKKPPAAPSAPVLQEDSTLDLLITPPPYSLPPPIQPEPPLPQPSPEAAGGGPAMNTRNRRAASPGGPADSTSAAILPLRALGPPDADGNQPLQYWPFSTSGLYNWRTQNAPFSERPKEFINLLETVLFTHQPTWDDCQQLLQILFTTEERERIQLEARKLVPGDNG
ncbi:proline-rich protein 36-like [Cervus elaphus]|uniref:proline-rich protein 36-like n=1 Tax=Cervus elaphus TaxID=9860 RepID=UPI001CC2A42B|nr:proline-rich protein 36-like [Cervus elaphus]